MQTHKPHTHPHCAFVGIPDKSPTITPTTRSKALKAFSVVGRGVQTDRGERQMTAKKENNRRSQASTGGLAGRRRRRKQGGVVANDLLRTSEVELLRTLWETGMWSYEALAEKFEVSPAVAKGIAHFKIHR